MRRIPSPINQTPIVCLPVTHKGNFRSNAASPHFPQTVCQLGHTTCIASVARSSIRHATLCRTSTTILARPRRRTTGRDRSSPWCEAASIVVAGTVITFDIAGPNGLRLCPQDAQRILPDLDAAQRELKERIGAIPGVRLERKRFAVAVHYREVSNRHEVTQVEQAADAVRDEHPALRKRGGKRVFELQPDIPWDKGQAVWWLIKSLGLEPPGVVALYLGDDVTDEDAFVVISDRQLGLAVRVGPRGEDTNASYYFSQLRRSPTISGITTGGPPRTTGTHPVRGFQDHLRTTAPTHP